MKFRLFVVVLGLLCWHEAGAQVQTISSTDNYTFICGSTVVVTDDNGGGAGSNNVDTAQPYSDNTFTITVCPDQPGQAIRAQFLTFDLQGSANPNNADYVQVFDANVADNAFLVGQGTGNDFELGDGKHFIGQQLNQVLNISHHFNSGNQWSCWICVRVVVCATPCTPVARSKLEV